MEVMLLSLQPLWEQIIYNEIKENAGTASWRKCVYMPIDIEKSGK